ncbi:MAG: hypothetical protein HY770_01540 [Chitinivibrionia bacterium]|nr:hypothetical protein [Chitinivibrionia bacterium]
MKEQSLQRHLNRLDRHRDSARRLGERFTRLRMIVFAAGGAAGYLGYAADRVPLAVGLSAFFGTLFLVLFYFHSRLKQRTQRLDRWIAIRRAHLARATLDWEGVPPARDYPVPEHHPYAHDLDIVGHYSLLRLIDTTVSTHGRRRLVAALLDPDLDPDAIEQRQQLVRELAPRSLLCDRLALEAKRGAEDGELQSDRMVRALQTSQAIPGLRILLGVETGLAALTLLFVVLEFGLGGLRLWGYTFLLYVLIYFGAFLRLAPVFSQALDLRRQLEGLGGLFWLLEKRRDGSAPGLMEVMAPFHRPGMRPSEMIRGIARVCAALSVQGNMLVHLALNAVLPWDLYFIFRYERVRGRIAALFPEWMEALGRLEAAAAPARFGALHPGYVFPRLDRSAPSSPRIAAVGMGHPLIPHSRRVVNDFTLEHSGSVVLLTGSNMSGKSAFLRTVGINACLALAGGPVCAESFALSVLRIRCSVRIQDDLEEGLSYFYAEVKRLKQILDAAADRSAPPILFLIDEIYKGTNNRERLLGSTCYLKTLLECRGLGLVTTHDLELATLEAEAKGIRNFHFQEEVADGKLVFDYRLRPGPCPTTNALRIMALEGLPTPPMDALSMGPP